MMDGLDKLIISLVILGDVTWVCLTDHGKTIGCDTVKEYQ